MEWIDSLLERTKRRIAKSVIAKDVSERVEPLLEKIQLQEALSNTIRIEDLTYRRISLRGSEELNPLDHNLLLKIMRYLYYCNPLCRRLVEIPVDFGFRIAVKADPESHPDLQKIIDRFWFDPYNDMPTFTGQIYERFGLDGELLLPVKVNPQDGFVRVMFEETQEIKKIEALKDDKRIVDRITMEGKNGYDGKTYKIIRYQDDPLAVTSIGEELFSNLKDVSSWKFRVGDAFYFRQYHLITGRGRPPLEPDIDWLDAHDHTLFDQLRNVALVGAHIYDVTLKGATPELVEQRKTQIISEGPPKPGSLKIHNDSETWQVLSPKIEPAIATELLVQVRKLIGLAMGMSETWMGASDDVNRNTAQIADTPPHRHLERAQFMEERMIREIIDFVIDQSVLHGVLDIDVDDQKARSYTVSMPDLTTQDNKTTADALNVLADAVEKGRRLGLSDLEIGRQLWYRMARIPQPKDLDDRLESERGKYLDEIKTQNPNNGPTPSGGLGNTEVREPNGQSGNP